MPLATAEETTIVVDFPSAMAYGDFMQTAKFVVMYGGTLHTLTPTADSTGGKVSAPDTQMIAYWREWEIPAQQKQITLAPGRADWRLIAIYTDGDQYQLKPQDLIGLKIDNTTGIPAAGNALIGGSKVFALLGDTFIYISLEDEVMHFQCVEGNPDHPTAIAAYDLIRVSSVVEIDNYYTDGYDQIMITQLQAAAHQYLGLNVDVVYEGITTKVESPMCAFEIT